MRRRYRDSSTETKATVHAKHRQRHAENPANRLVVSAKKRAAKNGLPFSLSIKDILIPDLCPLLGIPLIVGTGRVNANSPTLDRIDNSKGYVPENVWVISYKANTIKSNATIAEIEMLARNLRAALYPMMVL